jgi:succinate dehydrogenase/fumarate reductase flavoprotein subunit
VSEAPYDVIIVGYGFAGGIAAITAHDAGARVLLIEKQNEPGGISICSAGGIRVSDRPAEALAYLRATNGGTTPDDVLECLANGMAGMGDFVAGLAEAAGARIALRPATGNYPFPGYRSFGFINVEEIPGYDASTFPNVRGSAAGAKLFKLVADNVALRGIKVRLGAAAERVVMQDGAVAGVAVAGETIRARAVILACGGFEADEDIKKQYWSMKPVVSAAVRFNTGDGLRMAQSVGASLWHMWHYHGSYGFRHPDPAYPFGIRLKRLPDWTPGEPVREDVRMSWILLDQNARRFCNEYEPYMQDTGHRVMEYLDPVTQQLPRVPAYLITDAVGRALYPLSAPTWHDAEIAGRYRATTAAQFDAAILITADSLSELAAALGLPAEGLAETVAAWNEACAAGVDTAFGRAPTSMMPIATPPFSAAPIWPIVSNTQGGPAHDAEQRVLDSFGVPIPGLYEAGEIGSVFGHLYMSGGNLAECFVGGRIAGRNAAAAQRSGVTTI